MHTHRRAPRGQTLALGAITLLILALMVFITLNITQSLHAKIKMQNYADAKAYTIAVQEARALNYIVYTNRAIASSYVAMANLHAYMAEGTMLADADFAAMNIMYAIAAQETGICCSCGWLGCCRINHCWHALEATWKGINFTIGWFSGEYGSALRGLDGPFRNTMTALDAHSRALNASQIAVRIEMAALLASSGALSELKKQNVGDAPVTDSGALGVAHNEYEFNRMFLSDSTQKKKIMADVINATRPDFTRDRDLGWQTQAAVNALFLPATQQRIRKKAGRGTWVVLQPTIPWKSGRTSMADRAYGRMAFSNREVSPGRVQGNTIASYAWGTLSGQWRCGFSTSFLPALGAFDVARISTGQSQGHTAGWLGDMRNRPHSGGNHNRPTIDLSRFMEFNIDQNAPYKQPSVFAASYGDTRFNERGFRSKPFEITESGHITFNVGSAGTGEVQLSNDQTGYSVSKAMVYYHRIGDWSDYPNFFNPYWRAKLEPMTLGEATAVLGVVDASSAALVDAMALQPNGRGAVNLK